MELRKILLVEDDVAFNFLNKLFLKRHHVDCQIDVSLHGEEALSYIKSAGECPEVILLDINMPVMDGLVFLEKYNAIGRCCDHTLVYMLSSSNSEEDKSRSLSYPFVKGFLEKPLDEQTLQSILEAVQDA